MKRILACCMVALLILCGCDAGGKPSPIHLDEGTGLSDLLPGKDDSDPAATSKPSGSDVLDQLLNLQNGLKVPEIPGFDMAELYREFLDLKTEIDKAGTDAKADKTELLTRLTQLRDTITLMKTKVLSSLGDKTITAEQAEVLQTFLDALLEEMDRAQEALK